VGSIETVHCGEVNPPPRGKQTPTRIATGLGRQFAKGEELGRFNMGSTVVLLFEPQRVAWASTLVPESTVQLGRPIARSVRQ
jgi:phosphatidylserine decarboxylase